MRGRKLALMWTLTAGVLVGRLTAQTVKQTEKQKQASSAGAVTAADSAEMVLAIRTMYAAAATDDLEKFHLITTDDFYAFDNGKRFDGDALMELIKKVHATGKVFVWSVVDPKVHASGDVAWVSYINEGSVTDASGTTPVKWLESVGLAKEKGAWRVQFLNSAKMAP